MIQIEKEMSLPVAIRIPDDLDFADLRLAREPNGRLVFDWLVVEVGAASDLPLSVFREAREDNVCGLLVAWYGEHLMRGGARDATMDDLIAETLIEGEHDQQVSHRPGRA